MLFETELCEPKLPDIHLGRVFDSHLNLLWFLVPMRILGPFIKSHFLQQLPFEVEKNLSRLASQWTERINQMIQEMGSQAETFIVTEIKTYEHLLVGEAGNPTKVLKRYLKEIEQFEENSKKLVLHKMTK